MLKKIFIGVLTLAIMLTAVTADAAAPKWLIYWYVCGTDIETTRIAFDNATDLMSDDPNAIILTEPDSRRRDALHYGSRTRGVVARR